MERLNSRVGVSPRAIYFSSRDFMAGSSVHPGTRVDACQEHWTHGGAGGHELEAGDGDLRSDAKDVAGGAARARPIAARGDA